MKSSNQRSRRSGFTIVELLVSMALIIFIMYVLAEAFASGSKAFRDLKAVADLNTRLRTANNLLRRYLAADHFEGRKRLSDPDFWIDGPPKEGFFRLWQGSAGINEGNDLDGNPSFRSTDHHLHFTVRLRGNQRGDFFQVKVPGSPLLGLPFPDSRYQEGDSFASQWAEVAVYMKQTGEGTEDPANPGNSLPLNTVFLRQRLLVPSREAVESLGAVPNGSANQYTEVSQLPGAVNLDFNSPGDITMPATRFGVETLPGNDLNNRYSCNVDPATYPILTGDLAGSDVLLTDVISMEIKVLVHESAYGNQPHRFISLHDGLVNSCVMPRPNFSGNARVFDTWSSRKDDRFDYGAWKTPGQVQTIPMYSTDENTVEPIRIRAIQITFRIWDQKTKQSRQVSLIQDM